MKMMMNKGYLKALWIVALSLLFCQYSFSQGFKVKEFKQNVNDGSAFHAPMDADGHPCGLIKVRTDNAELKFKGNIVGDIENKTNEYWVYMAQGSKLLNILHPSFLPVLINFNDYSIGEVSSKATYILTLSEQKYNKEKSGLVATVKPETAALYIDDVFIENLSGNGLYQLYLPKGDHVCRVEQKGYRPNAQVVATGKGTQNLNVELESVMAELDVKCKTGTAEIYIDGELKGNGSWKGSIFAGEHQIEARQQNYESNSQTISIAEKESRSIVITGLKRSMGKIRVETIPSNMPIIIDGKLVGNTPCTKDVESGKHYVSCNAYGCEPYRSDVDVEGSDIAKVAFTINFNEKMKEEYEKAYNGDLSSILNLACYNCISRKYKEALFWIERHPLGEKVILDWSDYGKDVYYRADFCCWIMAYLEEYGPDRAIGLYNLLSINPDKYIGGLSSIESEMHDIGGKMQKKKDYDTAIRFLKNAGEYALEDLGDCYNLIGDKENAAHYYKKCYDLIPQKNDEYYNSKRGKLKKKLKELGY